jgi:hypothetical protein
MEKLAKVEVVIPPQVAQILDDLLVFDARCLTGETSQQLIRLLPKLAFVRRAWRNLYRKYGCTGCPKPDPSIAIAARLRRGGVSWADIYRILGADAAASTLAERKSFKALVKRKMRDLHNEPRQQLRDFHSKNCHTAGGFCDKCQNRYRRRLRKEYANVVEGKELSEERVVAALSQRYDVAQWLLNNDEGSEDTALAVEAHSRLLS